MPQQVNSDPSNPEIDWICSVCSRIYCTCGPSSGTLVRRKFSEPEMSLNATVASTSADPDEVTPVPAGTAPGQVADAGEQAGTAQEEVEDSTNQTATKSVRFEFAAAPVVTIPFIPTPVPTSPPPFHAGISSVRAGKMKIQPSSAQAGPSSAQGAATSVQTVMAPTDSNTLQTTPDHLEITPDQADAAVIIARGIAVKDRAAYETAQQIADVADTRLSNVSERLETARALLVAARYDAAQEVDDNPEDNPAVESARFEVAHAQSVVEAYNATAEAAHAKRDQAQVQAARADSYLAKVEQTAARVKYCMAKSRYEDLLLTVPKYKVVQTGADGRARVGSAGDPTLIAFFGANARTRRASSWQAGVNRGVVILDLPAEEPGNTGSKEDGSKKDGSKEDGSKDKPQRDRRPKPLTRVSKFLEHLKNPKKKSGNPSPERPGGPQSPRTSESPAERNADPPSPKAVDPPVERNAEPPLKRNVGSPQRDAEPRTGSSASAVKGKLRNRVRAFVSSVLT
jgi:hypothetical protein